MNINRVVFCFGLLLILAFAGGCNQAKERGYSIPTSSATPTFAHRRVNPVPTDSATCTPAYESDTPVPTSSRTPSRTPLPPSATATHAAKPTPTLTQTNLPWAMNYQCLEIKETSPSDAVLHGVLVLNNESNTDAFLWDLETGTQVKFPRAERDRLLSFEVSLDGKRVLYRKASNTGDQMIIATSTGQVIWSVNTPSIGTNTIWYSWFDNERLVDVKFSEKGVRYLAFLNLVTGERGELYPGVPNLYISQYPFDPNWQGFYPVYDPNLTRAVYPALREQSVASPVVLWDLEQDQELAKLVTMDGHFGNTPIWAHDGSQFFMATYLVYHTSDADEFYSVSRDGVIRQLTHFMDHFSASKIYNSYSLSPDGQLMAFWIEAGPRIQTGARLAVLNVNTGNVTNYCIENTSPDITVVPIWSPDSKQLLLNLPDPNNDAQRYAVIVDMANSWAAKIIDNWMPMGWMVSP